MNQENYFPWEETPDMNVLPGGTLHFNIDELLDDVSSSGKRMFRARFSVLAPTECAGMTHFENYVTGSDEAPTAILPGSFGTRNFKAMMKAAQIPPNNDVAMLCANAANAQFMAKVSQIEEKEGEYKGTLRNRINAYFRIGERQVEVDVVKGAGGLVGPAVAAPVAAAAALAPAATAAVPTAALAPVAASVAPAPVTPAVAATLAPATPATPAAPVQPAAAPAGPAPAPAGPQMECMACKAAGSPGMMIDVADFGNHMQQTHAMGGGA